MDTTTTTGGTGTGGEQKELFESNLFKLQGEELLKEAAVGAQSPGKSEIDSLLHQIKHVVETASPHEIALTHQSRPLGFRMRSPQPVIFTFTPPAKVDVVGSYLLGAVVRPVCNVDVLLQLPNELVGPKDHLNYRYLEKRAGYLQHALRLLMAHPPFESHEWVVGYFRNDPLKPMIQMNCKGKGLIKKFIVRIGCSVDHTVWRLQRLLPNTNGIRGIGGVTANSDGNIATPLYNQVVLEDMFYKAYLKEIKNVMKETAAFHKAVLLLKVWARHRQFVSSEGDIGDTLNGYLLTLLMWHLFSSGKIAAHLTCYQMFRVCIHFLSTHNWAESPIVIRGEDGRMPGEEEKSRLALFQSAFDIVMMDSSCHFNFAARVSKASVEEMKHEATLSLALLDGTDPQGFDELFVNPVLFALKFDCIINATLPKSVVESGPVDPRYPSLDALPTLRNKMYRVLRESLTDRAVAIAIKFPLRNTIPAARFLLRRKARRSTGDEEEDGEDGDDGEEAEEETHAPKGSYQQQKKGSTRKRRKVGGKQEDKGKAKGKGKVKGREQVVSGDVPEDTRVTVGLLLDKNNWGRTVDIGPSAEDKVGSAKYRELWGTRSELRRFNDGRITEAVVWDSVGARRHLVSYLIAKFILNRHLSVAEESMSFFGEELDSLLELQPVDTGLVNVSWPAASASFTLIEAAFRKLHSQLADLREIPLSLLSISCTHPGFRHTAPFPPVPAEMLGLTEKNRMDFACEPIPVVVQFESSNKWPADIMAINRIKTAFYLKFATALHQTHTTRTIVATEWVDALVDGYAFRIRIFHDKELTLHKESAKDALVASAAGKKWVKIPADLNTEAGKELEQNMINLPLHASTIKGLLGRFPMFGPICRIALRWVQAHMFGDSVPHEAIELIVASLFTRTGPVSPPNSLVTGFHRFLRLLGWFKFEETPLIVDVVGDMEPATYQTINEKFHSVRAANKGPCVYIGTARDPESKHWSASISESTLAQLRAFSQAAATWMYDSYTALNSNSTSTSSAITSAPSISPPASSFNDWKTVFTTDVSRFDVCVWLTPSTLSAHVRAQTIQTDSTQSKKKAKFKPPMDYQVVNKTLLPYVGLNVMDLYIRDLRQALSTMVEIWWDGYGGRVVGLKWTNRAQQLLSQLQPKTTHPPLSLATAAFAKPLKYKKNGAVMAVGMDTDSLLFQINLLGQGVVNEVKLVSSA